LKENRIVYDRSIAAVVTSEKAPVLKPVPVPTLDKVAYDKKMNFIVHNVLLGGATSTNPADLIFSTTTDKNSLARESGVSERRGDSSF